MDKSTLKSLTELSRIHCTEEEEAKLLKDLDAILNYVALLNEVDTEHIPECNHVLSEVSNVTREDLVHDLMPRKLFLENAPDQIGGMIRTPSVIKKQI